MSSQEEFHRIKQLPPYVFEEVNKLKAKLRAEKRDIIDLGMGNPDMPTPQHIVDKLVEASQNPRNHRYSVSRGIYKLRLAICDWYKRRYDVDLDPDSEAIVTIGSKEGIAHLSLAMLGAGDVVLAPTPTYPIHQYSVIIANGDLRSVPLGPGQDFFANLVEATRQSCAYCCNLTNRFSSFYCQEVAPADETDADDVNSRQPQNSHGKRVRRASDWRDLGEPTSLRRIS